MRAFERLVHDVRSSLDSSGLGSCDAIGARARVLGRPFVSNLGHIQIGSGLVMSSIPVRSHLVTGPNGRLTIGDRVHISHGTSISAHAELVIGDDVVIGPFAMLLDSDYHETGRRDSPGTAKPIHIGRGVRIGAGVVVLRGAVIGDGAVIEPNSVVNRYVPGAMRASGVPARPVIVP
jgi:maltose O-acetyltransferase